MFLWQYVEMDESIRTTIYLPKELLKQAKRLCIEKETSVTELIKGLLEKELNKYEQSNLREKE